MPDLPFRHASDYTMLCFVGNQVDITWTEGKFLASCIIEVNLAIMCNCALLLRPFAIHHVPSLFRHKPQDEKTIKQRREPFMASRSDWWSYNTRTGKGSAASQTAVPSFLDVSPASQATEGVRVGEEFTVELEGKETASRGWLFLTSSGHRTRIRRMRGEQRKGTPGYGVN